MWSCKNGMPLRVPSDHTGTRPLGPAKVGASVWAASPPLSTHPPPTDVQWDLHTTESLVVLGLQSLLTPCFKKPQRLLI